MAETYTYMAAAVKRIKDKMEELLGGNGLEYISDTVAHTPPEGQVFVLIEAFGDVTISSISGSNITGSTMTNFSLPDGRVLYGRFTSVTVSSGKLIAYKGV